MKRQLAAAVEVLTSRRVLTGAAVLGVISAVLAVGVSTALSRLLALPQGAELPETRVAPTVAATEERHEPPGPRALSRDAYITPILRRNMFDSAAVNSLSAAGGEESSLTDLNLTLLATVVASPDIYSSALIADGGRGGKPLGYGIGDKLPGGDGVIVSIEQKRVLIRRASGREEYLEMGGGQGVKPAPVADAAPGEEEEGITREGDKVIIERKVIDDALGNLESLASKIRAVPHKGPDGEVDGFRLSAIRRGTLFDKLGIKNGDIIHAVNGQPLTSADGALMIYQQMQNESNFSFEVTRRNQKQTLAFEVR